MKKLHILFLLVACLFIAGCFKDDEPKDRVKDIWITVSPETSIMYPWGDDMKENPIECMLVMMTDEPGVWQQMALGAIEGFTYERGHEYYLSVRKTILANPPADGGSCSYSLLKILSDMPVEVSADEEIASINDISYQELCPFQKYAVDPLFYVNGEGKITYYNGDRAPDYESARLYIENVLPLDDPNWIKFQKVPYMAVYSYVFSPVTGKVRLIRNGSSGPMFISVIPKDEFNYIVSYLPVNEELEYTIVLANVQKLGLQMLSFKIRKR